MAEKIGYAPAGVAETFYIDWEPVLVSAWRPEHRYSQGSIVRPTPETGFLYEATSAGQAGTGKSGYNKPDFPAAAGETIRDGSITWTARNPDSPSLESISDSQWTLDEGATEQASTIDGFVTSITAVGATAGEQYRMTNRITRSTGEVEEDSIILETLDPPDV